MGMKTTHAVLARGFAKAASSGLTKTAAARRWLEDADLVKLCRLFHKNQSRKK